MRRRALSVCAGEVIQSVDGWMIEMRMIDILTYIEMSTDL